MDQRDAFALLDVMRMQAVYAPPPIDRDKFAATFLAVSARNEERSPVKESVTVASHADDTLRAASISPPPELKQTKGRE